MAHTGPTKVRGIETPRQQAQGTSFSPSGASVLAPGQVRQGSVISSATGFVVSDGRSGLEARIVTSYNTF